ncbi:aromatic amino acid lyase [Arthrobacter ginkgonis]|uniref:Aromatic amino acid lyase n=1 Tax=Arthrobacter ginkgonis TaxID=1630594 RepID=A0ABP7CTN8_9MICC
MSVFIDEVQDLSLENFSKVAHHGEACVLTTSAKSRIEGNRDKFLAFTEAHSSEHVYGVTTKHHTGAKAVLSRNDRTEYSTRLPSTPATFGTPLPERLVRGIVFARLTDVLNGTACLRPTTVDRLLGLLDSGLAPVPRYGNGEPGDIIPLGTLLRSTFNGTLEIGEGMALINGSPVGTAVLADAAVNGRGMFGKAAAVFALAAAAIGSPSAHYASDLGRLWNDPHQVAALDAMRDLLGPAVRADETPYQAPVSFRSAPRLLGWLHRTQKSVEECALISLQASSNNPVFCPPSAEHPTGTMLSNGGYHNPMVAPSLDALSRAWADVCQLATSQVNRLCELGDGLIATEAEPQVSLFYMTSAGWAEEARTAATTSLISVAGGSQTDTGTPDLLAWNKSEHVRTALDANLAVLALVSAHTIARRNTPVPERLKSFQHDVLAAFPLGSDPEDFGDNLGMVAQVLDGLGSGAVEVAASAYSSVGAQATA